MLTFWKNKKEKREDLHLAFEAQGHRFYTFADVAMMPEIRIETFYARLEQVRTGVMNEDILAFCSTAKQYGNDGKFSDVMALISYLETVASQPINLKPAVYLSNVIILVDDEPKTEIEAKYEKLKLNLIEKDERIRDFFFGISVNLLKSWDKEWESTEAWAALMNPTARSIEKIFLKEITSDKFRNTTSQETKKSFA